MVSREGLVVCGEWLVVGRESSRAVVVVVVIVVIVLVVERVAE